MEVARLVLDYIEALAWPAVVIVVVLRYRRLVIEFLERVTRESEEISGSVLGLNLTTKFRKEIAQLAEQQGAAAPELQESLTRKVRDFARDEFRLLAPRLTDASISVRRDVAREVTRVVESLDVDDLLEFASSPIGGERVGAAIGFRAKLRQSRELGNDPRVAQVLRDLLYDRLSWVRYRAADAIRASPELSSTLKPDLQAVSKSDRNAYVREQARKALQQPT